MPNPVKIVKEKIDEKFNAKVDEKIEIIKKFYEELKDKLNEKFDWKDFRASFRQDALKKKPWTSQDGADYWLKTIANRTYFKFASASYALKPSKSLTKWYKDLEGDIKTYFDTQFIYLYGEPKKTDYTWTCPDKANISSFTKGRLYKALTLEDTFDDYISKPFKTAFNAKKSVYEDAKNEAANALVSYYEQTFKVVKGAMNTFIKELESNDPNKPKKRK